MKLIVFSMGLPSGAREDLSWTITRTFGSRFTRPISAMAVMSAKIEKEWRNKANRRVNCDSANVDKTVEAAQEQLAAIRALEERGILQTMPEKLRETAALRCEHPEATLSELAELHEPPATKSAVNHRMRKLLATAKEE